MLFVRTVRLGLSIHHYWMKAGDDSIGRSKRGLEERYLVLGDLEWMQRLQVIQQLVRACGSRHLKVDPQAVILL